ncbi:unnamed protein product [Arabis nemorensis]|uniref:Uncharacterized protein n=1 Tax=Arabis nemorensis TaxID=586526 RepID=A0A565BDY8_9BRAS|nr:unnamed protein product [Arabis nemorensis]
MDSEQLREYGHRKNRVALVSDQDIVHGGQIKKCLGKCIWVHASQVIDRALWKWRFRDDGAREFDAAGET